jgi:formamidopyrimidine-DNA glycosylase
MPELPEVETIRRQLSKKIVGKKIEGKEIKRVLRRAKLLIICFEDGSSLLIHLKLTGQLIFGGKPGPYTRRIFKFDDGSNLIFNDARKFGWFKKTKSKEETEKELSSFGPEALEIDLKTFRNILKKRTGSKIKTLLMDQNFIAGIGNIYSDEILYRAKVHPLKKVNSLTDREVVRIFKNIKKVLKEAIRRRGSSVEYYLDAFGRKGSYHKYHLVYQKEGQKCKRCQSIIKRIKIGSRSAHFCPGCQKL